MNSTERKILTEGKYLGKRISREDIAKLYFWNEQFYEVMNENRKDRFFKVEKIVDTSLLDFYVQSICRTGTPILCEWDEFENLREVGKLIQPILECDHQEFLHDLYRDQRLDWYCKMIEVRAAYLLDEILPNNIEMSILQARDIAIEQLLQEPQSHMEPPYVKTKENENVIFPDWLWNGRIVPLDEIEYIPNMRGSHMVIFFIDKYNGWEYDRERCFQ